MYKKILLCLFATAFSIVSVSAEKESKPSSQQLLKNYYKYRAQHFKLGLKPSLKKFNYASFASRGDFNCVDSDKVSCVKAACAEAKDCNYDSDLKKIINACKGVDGACVKYSCAHAKDCNYDSDLFKIINLCKSANGDCIEVACKYAGDCNYDSDLEKIANACKGVDAGCVETACAEAKDCNYDSDLFKIIDLCKN